MNKRLFLFAIVGVVVLLGGLVYWEVTKGPYSEFRNPELASKTGTTPPPPPSVDENDSVQTYSSPTLGAEFEFLTSQGSPVMEQDKRIYVGGPAGQWVEIYTKAEADDLASAIKKQFLSGITAKDCTVEVQTNGAISTGQILITGFKGSIDEPIFSINKCPANYRQSNGISYFWYDDSHPDKFAFFSIGQYAILAEPPIPTTEGKKTWQDTFRLK